MTEAISSIHLTAKLTEEEEGETQKKNGWAPGLWPRQLAAGQQLTAGSPISLYSWPPSGFGGGGVEEPHWLCWLTSPSDL